MGPRPFPPTARALHLARCTPQPTAPTDIAGTANRSCPICPLGPNTHALHHGLGAIRHHASVMLRQAGTSFDGMARYEIESTVHPNRPARRLSTPSTIRLSGIYAHNRSVEAVVLGRRLATGSSSGQGQSSRSRQRCARCPFRTSCHLVAACGVIAPRTVYVRRYPCEMGSVSTNAYNRLEC